jgi:hypothetical protein
MNLGDFTEDWKAETVARNEGITPDERYLKRLCDRSFLSLWRYVGLYRNQKSDGKGDGKELCDLLVYAATTFLSSRIKVAGFKTPGIYNGIGQGGSEAPSISPRSRHGARVDGSRATPNKSSLTVPARENSPSICRHLIGLAYITLSSLITLPSDVQLISRAAAELFMFDSAVVGADRARVR